MAIYTNLNMVDATKHGMFESSRLKATNTGSIYDVIVKDTTGKEISVDNGVAIKVGAYTGEGLQTRYATVATAKDKIAVVGTPAIVKDAFTKQQEGEYNFYNEAGAVAKAYQVLGEESEIFAVANYQFTAGTVAVGALVVVDGNGGYKVVTSDPSTTNGFVGKVHSIASNGYYPMVRIEVIQNEQL